MRKRRDLDGGPRGGTAGKSEDANPSLRSPFTPPPPSCRKDLLNPSEKMSCPKSLLFSFLPTDLALLLFP